MSATDSNPPTNTYTLAYEDHDHDQASVVDVSEPSTGTTSPPGLRRTTSRFCATPNCPRMVFTRKYVPGPTQSDSAVEGRSSPEAATIPTNSGGGPMIPEPQAAQDSFAIVSTAHCSFHSGLASVPASERSLSPPAEGAEHRQSADQFMYYLEAADPVPRYEEVEEAQEDARMPGCYPPSPDLISPQALDLNQNAPELKHEPYAVRSFLRAPGDPAAPSSFPSNGTLAPPSSRCASPAPSENPEIGWERFSLLSRTNLSSATDTQEHGQQLGGALIDFSDDAASTYSQSLYSLPEAPCMASFHISDCREPLPADIGRYESLAHIAHHQEPVVSIPPTPTILQADRIPGNPFGVTSVSSLDLAAVIFPPPPPTSPQMGCGLHRSNAVRARPMITSPLLSPFPELQQVSIAVPMVESTIHLPTPVVGAIENIEGYIEELHLSPSPSALAPPATSGPLTVPTPFCIPTAITTIRTALEAPPAPVRPRPLRPPRPLEPLPTPYRPQPKNVHLAPKTLQQLWSNGIKGSLFRLSLPLRRATFTDAQWREVKFCVRLRRDMKGLEKGAKRRERKERKSSSLPDGRNFRR